MRAAPGARPVAVTSVAAAASAANQETACPNQCGEGGDLHVCNADQTRRRTAKRNHAAVPQAAARRTPVPARPTCRRPADSIPSQHGPPSRHACATPTARPNSSLQDDNIDVGWVEAHKTHHAPSSLYVGGSRRTRPTVRLASSIAAITASQTDTHSVKLGQLYRAGIVGFKPMVAVGRSCLHIVVVSGPRLGHATSPPSNPLDSVADDPHLCAYRRRPRAAVARLAAVSL